MPSKHVIIIKYTIFPYPRFWSLHNYVANILNLDNPTDQSSSGPAAARLFRMVISI